MTGVLKERHMTLPLTSSIFDWHVLQHRCVKEESGMHGPTSQWCSGEFTHE